MRKLIPEIQIGKNGLTEGTLGALENAFKTHANVKIDVLKAFTREREIVEKTAKEIVERLGKNYTYRIVGFVIAIKKWRKARR